MPNVDKYAEKEPLVSNEPATHPSHIYAGEKEPVNRACSEAKPQSKAAALFKQRVKQAMDQCKEVWFSRKESDILRSENKEKPEGEGSIDPESLPNGIRQWLEAVIKLVFINLLKYALLDILGEILEDLLDRFKD